MLIYQAHLRQQSRDATELAKSHQASKLELKPDGESEAPSTSQPAGTTHLKMGLSMAQLRAQPRDTHSLAFSVLLGSLPKKSFRILISAGTRELPPITSIAAISPVLTLASASACIGELIIWSRLSKPGFQDNEWLAETALSRSGLTSPSGSTSTEILSGLRSRYARPMLLTEQAAEFSTRQYRQTCA